MILTLVDPATLTPQCVSSGILLGAGKQKIAAVVNLVCYYSIGLPMGIALMFAANMRIFGMIPRLSR